MIPTPDNMGYIYKFVIHESSGKILKVVIRLKAYVYALNLLSFICMTESLYMPFFYII